MIELLILWFAFGFFSFGILGLNFIMMRRAATRPWRLKINKDYMPKVSIIVPTYNESNVIRFKLANLAKIDYPKELTQIIVMDSNSSDDTVSSVRKFTEQHSDMNIRILTESERKGKTVALNLALRECAGDVVVVSDADCFWPSDILQKSLPFLSDPDVGAISGPKVLLNPQQSWVTQTESTYLNAMNMIKVGESKTGSTLMFEGGFSAYNRGLLEAFDPYNTGSDDCGTLLGLAVKGSRALSVSEANFYTAFPATWKEKINVKIRRSNQIIRVLLRYISLFFRGQLRGSRSAAVRGIFTYVVGPIASIGLVVSTIFLLFQFPYLFLVFLVLIIPKVESYFFESVQNYVILLLSIVSVVLNKRFLTWTQPADRVLLNEDMLRQHGLI